MADFSEDSNPYEVLGILNGPDATADEIAKAYKALALKKHPDKNRNNPNAAEEFQALRKAYDVLTDPDAKAALDTYLKAKAARTERDSHRSDKRRKLREELERRERHAASERSEEEVARAHLQAEVQRLRRKWAEQQAATAAAAAAAAAAQAAATAAAAAGPASTSGQEVPEQHRRTLKVSWDGDGYTSTRLRELFAAFGGVEEVVVRPPKKRKKSGAGGRCSALVVMGTQAAAVAAAASVVGGLEDPLLVVPLLKTAPEEAEGSTNDGEGDLLPRDGVPMPSTSGRPPASGPVFPGGAAVHRYKQQQQQQQQQQQPGTAAAGSSNGAAPLFPSFSSFPGAPAQQAAGGGGGMGAAADRGPGSGGLSFEEMILQKMRRAAGSKNGVGGQKD